MKAIVLTCDRYLTILDHTIQTYQNLWPSHPFTFRVPYQTYPSSLKEKYGDYIELIPSPKQIKLTVKTLLEDLPDSEWIYWCIDDKYLVQIEEEKVNEITHHIQRIQDPQICGVSFCRARGLMNLNKNKNNTIRLSNNIELIQRVYYNQIWFHQFLRVKVLKDLFAIFPDHDFKAKEMDQFKHGVKVPPEQKLYVSNKNMVIFGESTTRGKLTKNCVSSMEKMGLEIPSNMERSNQSIIIGKLPIRFLGIEVPFL
ncbi:hypothetical protein [Cyanobacterium aponinum]|uniref:hypothetical protein n=1 Tax=Cyanobacterium aponinum TaxID=379064 RepID=UPI000C12DAD8|nr:hypothetical protein [Cyanobacterium aponinum]PHV64316.1 hypothetical protein CSQ80_00400 [Cyanobacterium aponinum IPPAS B-1201]